ncbi:glycosyltransferase [Limnobaculum xujianqingii]|uniref:glycosyltransferase n=1 Tax=Limnobaculum xujianqingii TaxID=2738837 RepID=UPI0011288114|nr:glycosyltransferase [Limnobaculum xujianqingii]
MNILHLSTGDDRGAFFGAFRTHLNLIKYNHNSLMYVAEKGSMDDDVYQMSKKRTSFFNFFYKVLRRLIVRRKTDKDRAYLLYGTTFSVSEIEKKTKFKPDMIIVYYVSGFLSDKDIYELQKYYQVPVAFYLMDAGMLTGGCHYPWECIGYQTTCTGCPAIKYPNLINIAERVLTSRIKQFREINSIFLSASKWLDEKYDLSAINAKFGREKLLIGIDDELFFPRSKLVAQNKLSVELPKDKYVLFVGAQSLNVPRKGYKYLVDALSILENDGFLLDGISILTVGDSDFSLNNVSHTKLKFIKDKTLYPYLYNLADVFICSSIEDAGPMMINESMMSGVPVISFKMGVAEDLIIDGETGFLADDINASALAEAIKSFISKNVDEVDKMKFQAREFALKTTSAKVQVDTLERIIYKIST